MDELRPSDRELWSEASAGSHAAATTFVSAITAGDLDTARVKGLSTHQNAGNVSYLHVSAGCGTSRYTPVRFACPPEATLLTLVARD